ncbi:tRNA ligase [Rhinocladiella similis]
MSQDPHGVAELVRTLEANKGKGRGGHKGFSCKKTTFSVDGSQSTVDSWRFNDWDYKRDDLPTYARGLFTTRRSDGTPEIVIRGYDKFFNVDEVPSTKWVNIENDTTGPYELSVKENGCIIFMSGLEDGTLLVCSKHSTGARSDVAQSHAKVGEKWVHKHLESVGKSPRDLALALRKMNVTAVAELCDDEFEEHVLEYPPETAGLYVHGINFNVPEFATLSGPEVHEFADAWGFKKAQYIIIQSLDKVQEFLAKCAETGSWEGRDTEGFVVRCKLKSKGATHAPDWFFKYKFEEPYLMYRQWRECTKSVIAGKPPKIRKHKKVTEEYLTYARRRLAQNPSIGKLYNQNHGIIKMRDDFLAEIGQKGSDIIARERAQGGDSGGDGQMSPVVLVPIATIGCGKTTVATALVHLFGFGHVQNDNIEGKRDRPQRFAYAVTNSIATHHRVVIADRNNHQKREREQIITDVSKVLPDTRFVALHYVHEPKSQMLDNIRRVTRERVLERGDNHQTIRAGSKGQDEIISIMEGFLHRFQGCNPDSPPDNDFDEVINLDVTASSLENLETVVTHLYNAYPGILPEAMPGDKEMREAIEFALQHQVDKKHDLDFNKSSHSSKGQKNAPTPPPQRQQQNAVPRKVLTVDQLVGKLEYFSVPVSATQINSVLSRMFDSADAEEARMYRMLKQSRRVQGEFHVTLIHRASASQHPDMWQMYTETYRSAIANVDLREKEMLTPNLGGARVKLERLVWDDRVMTFVVRIFPADEGKMWPTANPIVHITVGTSGAEVKPVESNQLLSRWEAGDSAAGVVHDKEVSGGIILEGAVKPVFQRNTFGK